MDGIKKYNRVLDVENLNKVVFRFINKYSRIKTDMGEEYTKKGENLINSKLWFGKYKGVPLYKVIKKDRQYTQYIINATSNKDLKRTAKFYLDYYTPDRVKLRTKVSYRPFRMIFSPANIKSKKYIDFSNMWHFHNWINQLYNTENGEVVSESFGEYFIEGEQTPLIKLISLQILNGGSSNDINPNKEMSNALYDFKLHNVRSIHNNCLFRCLEYAFNIEIDIMRTRKAVNIKNDEKIDVMKAYEIIEYLKLDILITDINSNDTLDQSKKYLLLNKSHYYFIESMTRKQIKEDFTKRGLMTFDFETRETEYFEIVEATQDKMYIIKDVICCVYYKEYKSTEMKKKLFISNKDKSSARQFIDFLNTEIMNGRRYNILAHNGSNFDNYFILADLTEEEQLDTEFNMRGTSIIGMNYKGNLFKDSCCFLTDKLENLSKSFQIEHGKITMVKFDGKELSSSQLCFYKPELKHTEFLELQHTDKNFWNEYVNYCLYDCIALYQIWNKFTIIINDLVKGVSPFLLKTCPLMSSLTIGSHSKKLLKMLNISKKGNWSCKKEMDLFINNDIEKYNFICNFKRGGISHCNQAGKHNNGISSIDITSQYPASLIHGRCPIGRSEWGTEYCSKKHGFYLIKNMKWSDNSMLFKPIAKSIKGSSLDWASNDFGEHYIDSYMLDYVIKNCGLISFDVEKSLLSDIDKEMSYMFGRYVNSFYSIKQQQDVYKESKDERYNEALRTTIKLYLNSLTGKLVENPKIHFSLIKNDDSKLKMNNMGVEKQFHDDKINDWIIAGVMVYSYSKRLLFEYINMLPNKSNDVIHVETDGIYFSTKHYEEFKKNVSTYKGDFKNITFGNELGNIKMEYNTHNNNNYFLGKKSYCIEKDTDKFTYKWKGAPSNTISDDGTKINLLNLQVYKDIYEGKPVLLNFKCLKKKLYGEKTIIMSYTMSRELKGHMEYKEYF